MPAKKNPPAKKCQNAPKINWEEPINKEEATSEDLGIPDISPLPAYNVSLFTHESAYSSKLTYLFQCSSLLVLSGNQTKGSANQTKGSLMRGLANNFKIMVCFLFIFLFAFHSNR
jgi:hypothetical protein